MSHSIASRSFGHDSFSFRQFFDDLSRSVPYSETVLLSTLPRGGLQIAQPQNLAESFVKSYVREWHMDDEAAWKAISTGAPSRGKAGGRFVENFLKPMGFEHVIACPVVGPILPGYVGALELIRTAEQGSFSEDDLDALASAASQLSDSLTEARASRTALLEAPAYEPQTPSVRQFVLNDQGELLFSKSAFDELDENIRRRIMAEAVSRSHNPGPDAVITDRLTIPDSRGDQWIVNATAFHSYPALSAGPVVFFSILPTFADWTLIRSSDFQADTEMARLVPAIKFMLQEYQRGPTLTEIAKTVHLSPFHFHRRFSDLFGLTPKHFLLECQINDAKGELLSGEKELAKIASDCGFAHQSHFTSRFKQATGLTPTRWRRMANANGR